MCGIFVAITSIPKKPRNAEFEQLLGNRGPDSKDQFHTEVFEQDSVEQDSAEHISTRKLFLTFISTVLSLRGHSLVPQPLVDKATGSVLCWNGEAWKIGGAVIANNDTQAIFKRFLDGASRGSSHRVDPKKTQDGVISVLNSLSGPYAFAFYDATSRQLYFGRDSLGRRSLLKRIGPDSDFYLSSVTDPAERQGWAEVDADGLYIIDLFPNDSSTPTIHHESYIQADEVTDPWNQLTLPYPRLNKSCPPPENLSPPILDRTLIGIRNALYGSIQLRIKHVREAYSNESDTAKIAILFSGGLDCSILARIAHDILPNDESIDLLNVAFENPRVLRAQASSRSEAATSPYNQCPDRITGRSTYAELLRICPERQWRFVEINVPYSETVGHRHRVVDLMKPHNTEMDLSISYALYFASRGIGTVADPTSNIQVSYETTARVLLSGLGADELFGGYQRHSLAFDRKGYPGLLEELELDINRLGKRNLGRDDRVMSNWGREARFPYLDEDFLQLVLELPVWEKCSFGSELNFDSGISLDPCKGALRLLAARLGMVQVANEKKRAIQFGARTAKMESGKTKGTESISRD